MKFSEIPGLKSTKEKLIKTVERGKVAHAQLFAGEEGTANLALAIAYATLLNCTNRSGQGACGVCSSCQKIKKFIHPDVHFIFPVSSAKNKTGKDVVSDSFIGEWRSFLTNNPYAGPLEWSQEFGGENKQLNISREESRNILKKLSLKSFEGEYKVMIIWLVEYMHPSAANALLKILEEPPEKTVFLLVSNDHEKIIGTILSRVQHLRIRAFKKTEISDHLVHHLNLGMDKASQISNISGGDLNQAINLIEEVEDNTHGMFRDWMRICFASNYLHMVKWAEEFGKINKIRQKGLLQYGLSVIRDSLLIHHGANEIVSLNASESEFVMKFSNTLDLIKLQKLYELMNSAFYHLERNGNPKIISLDTSLQISSAFRS